MGIVVTGASGLVGSAVASSFAAAGHDVSPFVGANPEGAPSRAGVARAVDLVDGRALRRALEGCEPTAIIHAAALTDVNACERDPARAFALNVRATADLARYARAAGIPFWYVSSHAVFAGRSGGEDEDDVPSPANVYALSKAAGEEVSLAAGGGVVRIMPVGLPLASRAPKSFGEWLASAVKENRDIEIFSDVRFNPTTPRDCAEFLLHLLERRVAPRVFHLGSREVVSKAEFALRLIKEWPAYAGRARAVSVDEKDIGARRPKETWVATSKTAASTGFAMPSADSVVHSLSKSMTEQGFT